MRRTRVLPTALFTIAIVVTLLAGPAAANHTAGVFELDGNPTNGAAPAPDWSSLFPSGSRGSAIAATFVDDRAGTDKSYFTGGGSKDPNDVPEWRWTSGDVAPDKDEITNAFVAAYRNPVDTGRNNVGDLIVVFGADRFSVSGDAQIGFWFFRSAVGMAPGGTFSGRHTVGDILVLSDFTQGGRIGTVKIFRWVGTGGSDGSLDLVSNGVDCADSGADDAICSQVNASAVAAPWAYVPKSGTSGTFPRGAFFEGAINVSRLVPGVRCFKTFGAETRSSQAVGAQLKDVALGPFDTCPRTAAPVTRTTTSTSSGGLTALPKAPGNQLPASGSNEIGWLALVSFDLLGVGSFLRRAARRRMTPRR